MNEPQNIDPSKIRIGPIRHESLSPELLERISAVYEVIGPYLDTNLEKFELNFMRDSHPENEVAIWMSITAAWISYHETYLNDELLPDDEDHSVDARHELTCRGTKGQANAPEWQRCEAFQSMIPQVERELFSPQPCFGVLPLQGNNSIACSASARLGASQS